MPQAVGSARHARFVAVCLTAGVLVAPPALAQYRIDHYTTSNGLPQNTAAALAQTPDGYLWIATYGGLVRFDGLRFTIFDRGNTPAMRGIQFLALHVDAAGTLWAGTSDSGLLRYRDGQFHALTRTDGLLYDFVGRLEDAPRGMLVFYGGEHTAGLLKPDGAISPVTPADKDAYVGPSGARWMHEPHRVVRTRDGRTTEYPIDITSDEFCRYRFEDRAGGLWLGTFRDGLYYLSHGTVRHFADANGVPTDQPAMADGQDRDGRVWMHGPKAVLYFDGALHALDLTSLFGSSSPDDVEGGVRSILCDREGTVWIGSNNHGVAHLSPEVLHAYSEADGLPQRNIYSISQAADGAILVGLHDGVARLDGGRFIPAANPPGVDTVMVDSRGVPWIGTIDGLWKRDAHGLTDVSAAVDHHRVQSLLQARDGSIYAGSNGILYSLNADGTRRAARTDGVPGGQIAALMEDRSGALWVGALRGVARQTGDRFVAVTRPDGSPIERVRAIHEDDSGAVWIGTFDSGLFRLKDGRATNYTTRTGLFSNGVFAIIDDGRGWFWMSSNYGIFRVRRRDLEDVADGRRQTVLSVAYGVADGMRSAECNGGRQPSAIMARDGRLWFPTQDGIVSIDPSRAALDAPPPLTAIEAVQIDGAAPPPGAVTVDPGRRELEIAYTAPTFFKPEYTQFRYRLVGLSSAWIDAGTRRAVTYSYLPPGSYTFEVAAAGSNGVWSSTAAHVSIVVRPFFYQTSWFKIAMLAGMVLLGLAISTYRVRRLKKAEQILVRRIGEATADLAAANRQLEQLATTDALTGVANRRRFDQFLESEWHRAIRSREPIALLMMDVDFFKRYNDTRGHQAGDDCLRGVGRAIAAIVNRTSDLVARYGGEEFAVVLGATDEAGAGAIAERIRSAVEGLAIPHGASDASGVVTVSIGAAVMRPQVGDVPDAILAAGDAALYRAKAAGRNRVAYLGSLTSGTA